MRPLYTIGYATKPVHTFIKQLCAQQIDIVVDVRSVPYSKIFKEFHRETLQGHLKTARIRYLYLGDQLGPRSKENDHYDAEGQVQFDKLQQSELFQQGCERLQKGISMGYRLCMLCACKDPAKCHRSLLIADAITRTPYSIEVQHILHDGTIESQTALEERLCVTNGIEQDLFSSPEVRLRLGYQAQVKAFAYKRPTSGD